MGKMCVTKVMLDFITRASFANGKFYLIVKPDPDMFSTRFSRSVIVLLYKRLLVVYIQDQCQSKFSFLWSVLQAALQNFCSFKVMKLCYDYETFSPSEARQTWFDQC